MFCWGCPDGWSQKSQVCHLGNRPKVMEDFRRELRVEAMEKLKRQREEYEWATSLSLL